MRVMSMGIVVLLFVGVLTILVGAIAAVIFLVGRNQRQAQKKSLEAEKIERMLKDGKINSDEAAELKKAVGVREHVPGLPVEDKHLRILSILEIINAVLGLLISPILILLLCVPLYLRWNASSGIQNWANWPVILIGLPVLFILGILILRLWAAIKLKCGSGAARIIILIFSVFDLTSIPIGLALGIYAFYVLLFREGAEENYKALAQGV